MTKREKEWLKKSARKLADDSRTAAGNGDEKGRLICYAQAECLAWVLYMLTGEDMGDLFPEMDIPESE